eukprot:scaffold1182_cov165-Amphora_coffeaeformis.AAC.9
MSNAHYYDVDDGVAAVLCCLNRYQDKKAQGPLCLPPLRATDFQRRGSNYDCHYSHLAGPRGLRRAICEVLTAGLEE